MPIEQKGITDTDTIVLYKNEVIEQLKPKIDSFNKQQDHYVGVFSNRKHLGLAFEHIAKVNKDLYALRVENPCFELDWIFNGQINDLLKKAEICDYLYMFKDREETPDPQLERDYLGTTLPEKTVIAMKTLVSFDHYFAVHTGQATDRIEKNTDKNCACPFYTTCHLEERKNHSETDVV